jgi:hypothetical protein
MQLDDLEKARDAAWKKLTEKEQEIHEIEWVFLVHIFVFM